MVVFPNAKINLGLRILRKREDGYHDLESIFFPLAYTDVLEIIPDFTGNSFTLNQSGIAVTSDPLDNLCSKAYHLIKKDFPQLPPLMLHIHKAIPAGAGLGGGSSDASFTLKLINDYFKLQLDDSRLKAYALQLGSDCVFFIINKPCLVTRRGEFLKEISLSLTEYKIAVIYPGVHIHTGNAFSKITPAIPEESITDIIQTPIHEWRKKLVNDFEIPVFKQYPVIADIKQQLYNQGAHYASLTGSGSAVYGIFDSARKPAFSFPENYLIHWSVGQ